MLLFLLSLSLVIGAFFMANKKYQINHSASLNFTEPSMRWDEGIPLGNGLTGVMLWGDGSPLKLSLDRNDLWDLRPANFYNDPNYSYETMRQWVGQNRMNDLYRVYEQPYEQAGPTKIPAGCLEMTFDKTCRFIQMQLDAQSALATVEFTGCKVSAFVHASEPIIIIQCDGAVPGFLLKSPDFQGVKEDQSTAGIYNGQPLKILGYENAEGIQQAHSRTFLQKGWGDLKYAFSIKWTEKNEKTFAVLSSATSNESDDPLKLAKERCNRALAKGYQALFNEHLSWWKAFWSQSDITVPNPTLQKQWVLDMYKFGSACRENALPASLQGPWTTDNGKLPPWRGDYHHDLNTQLCYWPAYSGNHLEQEAAFIEWLWATKDAAREWTRRFFDKPGLAYPMTVDAEGKPIGGWHQYTCSATTIAWLAQHFYLHWQYSRDGQFLQTRAFPFLQEVAVFLESITEFDDSGKRFLPLSSSPEMYDNSRDAWFENTTNYDIALIRFVFEKTSELASLLGNEEEVQKWQQCLSEMPEIAVDGQEGILLAKDHPLKMSHRHHSHLLSIYPLGLISHSRSKDHREIIRNSMRTLQQKGTEGWTGYSFAWQACLAARAMRGEIAEKALEIFSKHFCLKNSLHCNGDYQRQGYSNFNYRPFTLEGNCAAAAAIQEMLLQSDNGLIRIFPAIPQSWKDVKFENLRAQGAFLISSEMKGGRIKYIKIDSEKGGRAKILNPFNTVNLKIENSAKSFQIADGYVILEMTEDAQLIIKPDIGKRPVRFGIFR
jgi:alpha-L-fucosidase 2